MERTLTLKIITRAKKNEIKGDKVYLTAPPVEGKANKALIELLAEHYGVSKNRVLIIKGQKSKYKTVKILEKGV
jgi:hypothetical protein